jgi:acetyl-CoA carboxylase carboxyl transferase subunit alpha
LDHIGRIFLNFQELYGDRSSPEDASMVSGIARSDDMPVTVIAQQKVKSIKKISGRILASKSRKGSESIEPDEIGRKLCIPIKTFVDIPGVFLGIQPEERYVAEAIAG